MTTQVKSIPKNRELPTKQANLFKDLVQYYEHRQYKKGLKSAEAILKKFPEHGETLALKGLFQSNLGKREEALQNIRLGIKKDITSHVCWHVFGLFYRADKNYKEAIRCYKTSLKYDAHNSQILRDLSVLQIQLRDYHGYLATRLQMLEVKPAMKFNWVAVAVAYHLLKFYNEAIQVIDTFMQSWSDANPEYPLPGQPLDNEISELILYKISILLEANKFSDSLQCITKYDSIITDKTACLEYKAKAFLNVNEYDNALLIYKDLLSKNPDNTNYLDAIESIFNAIRPNEKRDSLNSLLLEFPTSSFIIKFRLLELSESPQVFIEEFSELFVCLLKKRIPSLFSLCKRFYSQSLCQVEEVVNSLCSTSQKEPWFPWLCYFNAQFLSMQSKHDLALEWIEKALTFDPKNIDFLMKRAQVLKRQGQVQDACDAMNSARLLDLSDRFVNSKSAKYYLRANKIEEAKQTITLFLKGEYPAKVADLVEIQTLWWEFELADAYYRVGNYGLALKYYDAILKQFDTFIEDQVDFHTYALRKYTLRNYVYLLRFEDNLHESPLLKRTLTGICQAYKDLIDRPELATMLRLQKLNIQGQPREASEKASALKNHEKMNFEGSNVLASDDADETETVKEVDKDPFGLNYLSGDLKTKLDDLVQNYKPLCPNFDFSRYI